MPRDGRRFRILAIEPTMDDELPFHATWTVEPFPGEFHRSLVATGGRPLR